MWFAHAIRGPACLVVVAVHLGYVFWADQPHVSAIGHFPALDLGEPNFWARLYEWPAQWHLYGTIAVCLFFLVSGFVVPYALERGTLGSFFVRRFFRLYPTLWVCLLVNLAVVALQSRLLGSAFPYDAKEVAGNAVLLGPYMRVGWIEPVLWSIAVEELFYLLAALAAWRKVLARRGFVVVAAAGLTAASLAGGSATAGSPLFWLSFNATFVIYVLLGVVFHQVYRGRWAAWEGAGLLVAVLAAFEISLHWGATGVIAHFYDVSGVVGLGLFAALYLARDRLPQSRLLDWLGNITYPLYMVHALNGYLLLRVVWLATGNYYVSVAVAVTGALALAALVHRLVDRPSNDFGRRLAKRMRVRRAHGRPVPGVGDPASTRRRRRP